MAKARQGKQQRRIFVLDTNVLMHDPTAIFRFEEHDVYIPMTVLEELDAGKKGLSESARNVRQVSRFLDELMKGASKKQIDRGLALPTAVPIIYELDDQLKPLKPFRFLGDQKAIAEKAAAVAAQAKGK